jgi:hypothetical protein
VNGRGLRQVMAVMRQSGAGYILTLAALGIFEWWSLGQRPYQQSRFSPHIWNSLLVVSATPPVLLCWIIIGQYHARLLISGSRLRMPGMLRVVCISLLGAAACTIFALLGPIWLTGRPGLLPLSAFFLAICAGLLISLFGGTRWQLPIYVASFGFVISIIGFGPSALFVQKLLGPVVLVVVSLTAWRLRVLINAFRAGSANKTLQYLVIGKWNMVAGWGATSRGRSNSSLITTLAGSWRIAGRAIEGSHQRFGKQSSAAAFGRALGSPQASSERSVWLIAMAIPIVLSFLPHKSAIESLRSSFHSWVFFFAFAGVTRVVARARRLGDLLWNQQGEIADLALLPGLGDARCQRRALLHAALIRPSIHYALWFCGIFSTWLILARTVRAPVQSILLLPELMCSILVLSATLSVGVLSRHLDRSSVWFKGWAYLLAIPAVFWSIWRLVILGPFHAPVSMPSLLIWQSLANALMVGGMVACLIVWGIQLSRKPNWLCQ